MDAPFFLGIHTAVGAGYEKATAHARRVGGNAMQFFSGNPRSYATGAIDPEKLARFAALRAEAGVARTVIHTPYLINFASDDPKAVGGSVRLVRHDLAFAGVGGVDFVNTHLGSYGKRDREAGFASVVSALGRVLEDAPDGVTLVLENSAGAGDLCGGTLEELGALLRAVDHPRLAVCVDTAHAWASGYDLAGPDGVARFLERFEREIGLGRLAMLHLNDTQVPLGGRRDRHWHIGEGLIGRTGFAALLAHARLHGTTVILETPGEDDDDMRNMETVRSLVAA